MRRPYLAVAVLLSLLAGALAPTPARAGGSAVPGVITTWQFTGDCTDCVTPPPLCLSACAPPVSLLAEHLGTALLTLRDYTPGTPLAPGNFVSFEYASVKMTLSETAADLNGVDGGLPAAPGGHSVLVLSFFDGPGFMDFITFANGAWCVGPFPSCAINLDNGTAYTWEQVPEPATLALLGASLLGLGLARRRR